MLSSADIDMIDVIEILKMKADMFDRIYRLFMNQHLSNEELMEEIRVVIMDYQAK